MPKNKPHKGLLKRVRVSRTGRIKMLRACGRHLKSHKPGRTVRKYRRPKYASGPDTRRVRSMLMLRICRRPPAPSVGEVVEAAAEGSAEGPGEE